MLSAGAFFLAILGGYFLLPFFLNEKILHFFMYRATSFEAAGRDRALKFMTDRLSFVSPNAVTIFGFLLIFLLVYLFQSGASYKTIFTVTLLAGFTDMLDGSLARNNGRVTKLGAVLDWSRDLLLGLVLAYFLARQGILKLDFIVWFFVGWAFLGVIRIFEFRVSGSAAEDYKFALDRIRLALAWYGVLFLLLLSYNTFLGRIGEWLIIFSIAVSWVSLLFHSAHLKILKEEKNLGAW
ncbi:MAG: CDP-alcohol phosphatidyltransferase family protein [bacterium]|nr:CDP-alcohol phosphatidyltransferase family protein [bacterium]